MKYKIMWWHTHLVPMNSTEQAKISWIGISNGVRVSVLYIICNKTPEMLNRMDINNDMILND